MTQQESQFFKSLLDTRQQLRSSGQLPPRRGVRPADILLHSTGLHKRSELHKTVQQIFNYPENINGFGIEDLRNITYDIGNNYDLGLEQSVMNFAKTAYYATNTGYVGVPYHFDDATKREILTSVLVIAAGAMYLPSDSELRPKNNTQHDPKPEEFQSCFESMIPWFGQFANTNPDVGLQGIAAITKTAHRLNTYKKATEALLTYGDNDGTNTNGRARILNNELLQTGFNKYVDIKGTFVKSTIPLALELIIRMQGQSYDGYRIGSTDQAQANIRTLIGWCENDPQNPSKKIVGGTIIEKTHRAGYEAFFDQFNIDDVTRRKILDSQWQEPYVDRMLKDRGFGIDLINDIKRLIHRVNELQASVASDPVRAKNSLRQHSTEYYLLQQLGQYLFTPTVGIQIP